MTGSSGLWAGDPIAPGEHVCWMVGAADEYAAEAGGFVARGLSAGDKVLIVGDALKKTGGRRSPASPALVVFDPTRPAANRRGDGRLQSPHPRVSAADAPDSDGGDHADIERAEARPSPRPAEAGGDPDRPQPPYQAMLDAVRREAHTAGRQGFPALRVLAQMERIAPPDATFTELVDHELRLGELAADSGTSVVCVYRLDLWSEPLLSGVTCVHPRLIGSAAQSAGFRILRGADGRWNVEGVVDFTGAAAFGAALRAAAPDDGVLRLGCDGLDLIDAAGLRALVEAAGEKPGRRLVLEQANATVRRLWQMSGYDDPSVPVEMQP